jgi:hypothetical protein
MVGEEASNTFLPPPMSTTLADGMPPRFATSAAVRRTSYFDRMTVWFYFLKQIIIYSAHHVDIAYFW